MCKDKMKTQKRDRFYIGIYIYKKRKCDLLICGLLQKQTKNLFRLFSTHFELQQIIH